ncbi:MAG TPA: DNA repair protein RecN [Saprospiraceae bacterium]|nr:DNA repair protein RecN [Saprospiraceae bacterium]
MIKTLSIKNYAIIEDLEIEFSGGLTIITGETGAGKSILLGALGLIMGERADLKVFFDQNEKCVIEAFFDVAKYDLKTFFEKNELDYEKEVVVRREITPSGKSRAFINDTPVNLDVLRQLSAALIDLHQQFDTLDIHEVSFQLRMVDALAGNAAPLRQYQSEFSEYQSNRRRLEQLIHESQSASKESEFLKFQLDELNASELAEGEQEKLENELAQLNNAEDIKRTLGGIFHHLNESENSLVGQLRDVSRSLASVRKFSTQLQKHDEHLESLILDLQELATELGDIAEEIEYDAERITEVQSRLDLIYKLQKKHQVNSVGELLEIQAQLEKQLGGFVNISDEIQRLQAEVKQSEKRLREQALQLSENRKTVIPDFEKKIVQQLGELSMASAKLEIQISETGELTATGTDEINFMFAANKGSRLQKIKDVASGGELSRLTLITKSLVASAIPLPTLIFDEIDSGVSGDVAQKMGNILRDLSNQHQVVVITHSPQVASKADAHYFVYKKETEERTLTKVKKLSPEERVRSLAVMLSQNPPSDAALQNARELLEAAN